jgi:hypothetical protein
VAIDDTGNSYVTEKSKCFDDERLDNNYVCVGNHGVGVGLHVVGWKMVGDNIGKNMVWWCCSYVGEMAGVDGNGSVVNEAGKGLGGWRGLCTKTHGRYGTVMGV